MIIIHNVLLFYAIFYFFLIYEFHNYQEDILLKNRYQELQRDNNSNFSQFYIISKKKESYRFYLFGTLFLMYFVDCFYCHICIFIRIFITSLCLLYSTRVTSFCKQKNGPQFSMTQYI